MEVQATLRCGDDGLAVGGGVALPQGGHPGPDEHSLLSHGDGAEVVDGHGDGGRDGLPEKQYTAMLMARSSMVLSIPPWRVPRPLTCQS